jgi:hypothetical protein
MGLAIELYASTAARANDDHCRTKNGRIAGLRQRLQSGPVQFPRTDHGGDTTDIVVPQPCMVFLGVS